MKTHGRIHEMLRIDAEALPASSAAGATSGMYDMANYDQALISVALGLRNASIGTISTVILDLMETSAVSAAPTSAAGGATGIQIGSAGNTAHAAAAGIRSLVFMAGTGSTTGETFRFGLGSDIVTFTWTSITSLTSVSTAWNSTMCYFGAGSAVEGSANTGPQLAIDSIQRALKSTAISIGGKNVFELSTPDTHSLVVRLKNSNQGNIMFANTAATESMVACPMEIAAAFSIRTDQLTATANKRFIGVKMTSVNQACAAAVTVIRAGGRYMPCSPKDFIGTLKVSS